MDRKNIEINPLLETYGKYIEKIDQSLEKELDLYSESEFIEPLKYSLDGGKRIRPIILTWLLKAWVKLMRIYFQHLVLLSFYTWNQSFMMTLLIMKL